MSRHTLCEHVGEADLLNVNWDLDVRHIVGYVVLERLGVDRLAYLPGHVRGLWDMVPSKHFISGYTL